MKDNTQEGWQKEFDRRTDATNYKVGEYHYLEDPNGDCLLDLSWYPESDYELDAGKVENFIRDLLAQQREELAKKVEGMKKRHGIIYDGFSPDADLAIYNQALDEVLALLSDNNKEE